MRKRRWLKVVAVTALILIGVEVVLRIFYGDVLFYERAQPSYLITRYSRTDEELFRVFRPGISGNFDIVFPDQDCPVHINSAGLRGPEITIAKPANTFRIACLGDSCTFGWRVKEAEMFTQRLEDKLEKRFPDRQFEVLNFGSPGYTSRHGEILMRRRMPDFSPDVVVVAYGFNDFALAPHSDDDLAVAYRAHFAEYPPWRQSLHATCSESAVYRFSRYLVGLPLHYHAAPESDGQLVRRVGAVRYREHLEAIRQHANSLGAEMVLVNSALPNVRSLRELQVFAKMHNLPLLDLRVALRAAPDHSRMTWKARTSKGAGPCLVRVRVRAPSRPESLHILGDRSNAGAMSGAVVALHDEGTAGDGTAGDAVFSTVIELAPGSKVAVAFFAGVPRPEEPQFMDDHYFHTIEVPADAKPTLFETPVLSLEHPFDDHVLPNDIVHPSSSGHELWAESLFQVLLTTPALRAFVAK
jgi:lysophospholipase L1-like esterase